MILINLVQLFYLVFAADYENWPKLWTGQVKYGSPAVLDFSSLFYEDIIEDKTVRPIYAAAWISLFFGLTVLYCLIQGLLYKWLMGRIVMNRVALNIAHLMYIPFGLGILPSAFCTYDDCWDSNLG
jgi:hypothetical protein